MELPLVVGVDGSASSLRAVDWAADEAALRGAPLRLVNASLWERYEGVSADGAERPPDQALAEDVVDAATRRAHDRWPDLRVSADVLPDDPVSVLLHEGHRACALVIGSRGRNGLVELLLGSVSLTVAARADCPVIVLRGGRGGRPAARRQPDGHPHRRIVLGVGDGPHSAASARFALQEAQARGAVLEAVRAWRWPGRERTDRPPVEGEPARLHERQAMEILESALEGPAAEHPSVRLRLRPAEGPARGVLMAASADADLLVLGSGRPHGHAHVGLPVGRVAHAVLHGSDCPVAVVPGRMAAP
ncbi:universal stress protein [Streptomyces sp. NPDC004528]|uniref:universal stress protein n=1 Tax=Streptomyces sp. NPDC004528 TaxID=3154550 RepID=UPI0033B48269